MLSRLALRLRLAVDDCDRNGGGTRSDGGRLVAKLIGGDDFPFSDDSARASSGLGRAGDGRSRGEFAKPGDLISNVRSVDSVKLNVRLTTCGDKAPSLLPLVAMAIRAASYALFPKLLLTEE